MIFKKLENGTFVKVNQIDGSEVPFSSEEPLGNWNEAVLEVLNAILIEMKKANV